MLTGTVISALCTVAAITTTADASRTQSKYGIDPSTPLASRIGEIPTRFTKLFTDQGAPAPTTHVLTEIERRKVAAAFAVLTPLHRRILSERLRSVSFADRMPHTALTTTVNPGDEYEVFDITIRAGILDENISEFLTQKERTCFDATGSSLSVVIEGGAMDAIVYVLLHEATHIVDGSLGAASGRGRSVWTDRLRPAPPYRSPLLEGIKFRHKGKVLNVTQAQAVYTAMSRTPFVSLYASTNWHDDLAELVTWYHLTQKLKQPYRLEVRDNGKTTYAYEPTASPLVRARFKRLRRWYG